GWRHLSVSKQLQAGANPNEPQQCLPSDSYDMFDLAGRYTCNDRWNLRFGVDNLFDRDPERTFPQAPGQSLASGTAWGSTNAGFYDILGRRYYAGMSFEF